MLNQVERNLEQEDVQACANKDSALIRITSIGLADPDDDRKKNEAMLIGEGHVAVLM